MTDLTPAEMAYVTSKGRDSAALATEYSTPSSESRFEAPGAEVRAPVPSPAPNGSKPSTAAEPSEDDEFDDEGNEVLDKEERPRDQNGKYVPHRAFHKERERRKAVETENLTLKERNARTEERLNMLMEWAQQGQQPAAADPKLSSTPPAADGEQRTSAWEEPDIDPDEDFIGAQKQWMRRQREDRERSSTERQHQAAQTEEQQVISSYRDEAQRLSRENPEGAKVFAAGYTHLLKARHQELHALGVADPNKRAEIWAREERAILSAAKQIGKSPLAVLYQMAQARGFSPQQVTQEAEQPSGQVEQPRQQALVSNNQPSSASTATAAEKIENITRGQKTNMSLSKTGGAVKNNLTIENILDMPDEELYKMMSKHKSSEERKKFLSGL